MRIGVFTYGMDGARMTGIARYAVELTRAMRLVRPDLEIILLNPYPESDHPWYREFPTRPMPTLKLLPSVVTVGHWQLHRAATELGLDILHDPCGIAPFLVPAARYKRVTTVHDAVPYIYPRSQPVLTRLLFRTLVPAARFTADLILTVSQASADDLVRFARLPRHKIQITPNGVARPPTLSEGEIDEALAKLGIGGSYFLYVGALHPRKNLGRVVDAFRAIRQRYPNVELVIVGPPSWGAQAVLKGAQKATGERNGVILTGFVSDLDLHALYYAARALVFPSLYEGFGLPALEAMSHGTPVIASTTSSFPEVVGNAGLLVEPERTSAIAKAMQQLLEDPALPNQLRKSGLERAKLLSWEATADATLRSFEALVSS